MKYTLDTNCIIDLEEGRDDSPYLRDLIARYRAKQLEIAIVAISASENQRGGLPSTNYSEFERKLAAADLHDATLLAPMAYTDVCFWDHALYADADGAQELEQNIHNILFPGTPITKPQEANYPERRWRNQKCDVQVVWAHIYHGQDALITRDENFHRNSVALSAIGCTNILRPSEILR